MKQRWVAFMSAIVLLASCSGNTDTSGYNFAENGAALCKNALKVLSDLSTNQNEHLYKDESVKMLNDAMPEAYTMKIYEEGQEQISQYLYFANALKSLQKVFISYQLQLDSKISSSGANLSEKMLLACLALDSIKLSETLFAKNKKLKTNISAGKFRIEGSLFQLTDLYSEIWNELAKNKLVQLNENAKSYETGIKRVSIGAFNSEKIKTIIEEPYSNSAVLINLYKLKLIRDNYNYIAQLGNRVNYIAESFNLLLRIQGELIKRKQDNLKILELNNTLEVLLNQEL